MEDLPKGPKIAGLPMIRLRSGSYSHAYGRWHMPYSTNSSLPSWRVFLLMPIAVLGALSISACGSSGNGNGGRNDTDEITILPSYGYQISASPTGGPLTVTIPDEGGMLVLTLDLGNTLNGDVDVSVDANNIVSVTDFTLQMLSTLAVDSDVGLPFLGAFTIEVTEDMALLPGSPPDSGAFNVVTATETVALQAIANGVEIRLDGGLPMMLTWDELGDLVFDDQALDWQRRAALAAETLEFTFVQFLSLTETLNWVNDDLATTNPLVASCDAFTGSPPANVLAQGETTFTWMGSGNTPLGGDDFLWAFTDCWIDDVGDTEDELINGSISLNTYIEVIDAQLNLTGTGYNEVIYNNLTVEETIENPAGVFAIDPDDTIIINGGLDLAFVGFPN